MIDRRKFMNSLLVVPAAAATALAVPVKVQSTDALGIKAALESAGLTHHFNQESILRNMIRVRDSMTQLDKAMRESKASLEAWTKHFKDHPIPEQDD